MAISKSVGSQALLDISTLCAIIAETSIYQNALNMLISLDPNAEKPEPPRCGAWIKGKARFCKNNGKTRDESHLEPLKVLISSRKSPSEQNTLDHLKTAQCFKLLCGTHQNQVKKNMGNVRDADSSSQGVVQVVLTWMFIAAACSAARIQKSSQERSLETTTSQHARRQIKFEATDDDRLAKSFPGSTKKQSTSLAASSQEHTEIAIGRRHRSGRDFPPTFTTMDASHVWKFFPFKNAHRCHPTQEIRKVLYKHLGSKHIKPGFIYMFCFPEATGHVKIGFEGVARKRITDWKKHYIVYKNSFECIRGEKDEAEVMHAGRVEALIFAELVAARRKETKCSRQGCPKEHQEWFCIDQKRALKVVEKWVSWMSAGNRYNELGELNPLKKSELEYCTTPLLGPWTPPVCEACS